MTNGFFQCKTVTKASYKSGAIQMAASGCVWLRVAAWGGIEQVVIEAGLLCTQKMLDF